MSPIEEPGDVGQLAVLEAIDGTLAGEPVDPIHAEMAELALLLADERPGIDADFAASLDRALERRFDPVPPPPTPRPRVGRVLHRHWWLWTPAAGLAMALIVAIVVVAAGGSGRSAVTRASSSAASAPPAARQRASSAAAAASSGAPSLHSAASGALGPSRASSSASSAVLSAPGSTPQPPANGRKTIQGAQLTLSTAPARIEAVAQEVFDVVGQFRGIVSNSNVTATNGSGGSAQFQLSIPSPTLPQAMAALSSLRYARVASRTDSTQDVNGQYESDVRSLADARALRTSLLKQLASATTQPQIDSLTARIHDAEASISSDEAALRGLNRQIDYSQVGLTINGGSVPPVPAQSGGFGLGKAAHDAGRVLTVAAGIALIGVAALVPLGLVAALIWWIGSLTRRRRREQALDLV
jgi:hypothetical protein